MTRWPSPSSFPLVASIALLAIIGAASAGRAQGLPPNRDESARSGTRSISLLVDAPFGCRDRDAFVEQVRLRTPRFTLVDDKSSGATNDRFVVTIVPAESGYTGILRVERGDTGSERRISAHACEEVSDALVLMIALAVDPNARTGASPSPVGSGTGSLVDGGTVSLADGGTLSLVEGGAAPSSTAGLDAASIATTRAPVSVVGGGTVPNAVDSISNVPAAEEPPNHDQHVAVGAELLGQAGLAPRIAAGGALVIDFRPGFRVDPTLALRLSLGFASAGTSHTSISPVASDVTARFDIGLARLDMCPLRFALGDSIGLLPCVALAGTLTFASGNGIAGASNQTSGRIYGELGPLFEWSLTPALFTDLQGALTFPIAPAADRYVVYAADGAAVELYAVPRVATALRLGFGVRLR